MIKHNNGGNGFLNSQEKLSLAIISMEKKTYQKLVNFRTEPGLFNGHINSIRKIDIIIEYFIHLHNFSSSN